eukprot:CAMPEP_0119323606 /NCGR_PEP_ID=MMETSP1333-20130426/61103_1 /TAXON_ID=418940 /ORGANISM="Scyphosphaera apsteinii, Strain RCC1455" /LENGTH=546 /DNA_ID=CAMNT_0007331091 /DNA_START=125 /DNA_END=1765 /DNA_ORIENTATION=-
MPMKAVLLFRKPETSTGRLIVEQAGLEVLRAQNRPFALICAVGPTRTGKSSILGRAFLRGVHENVFEIGTGVTSHTGGVWISSQPITVQTGAGESINVLLIDTEGFSGISGHTSRTYEANVFGITFLMSSVMIFNSMFPIDASTVSHLNGHVNHALQMLRSLENERVWMRRQRPKLLWAVQGFNVHNLKNSRMTPHQLLDQLLNRTRSGAHDEQANEATAAVLGNHVATSHWLAENLFSSVELVPVRRPHTEDEVVANLASYPSQQLSSAYLQDADHLRESSYRDLMPAHQCKRPSRIKCKVAFWDGQEFVDALSSWLKFGFVVDASDDMEASGNETQELHVLREDISKWLNDQCRALQREFRWKLWVARKNVSLAVEKRELAQQEMKRRIKQFRKSSMSRTLQQAVFWRYPGKGATLVENEAHQREQLCSESLDETRKMMESVITRRHIKEKEHSSTPHIADANTKVSTEQLLHKASSSNVELRLQRKDEKIQKLKESLARNSTKPSAGHLLSPNAQGSKPIQTLSASATRTNGQAREVCFMVYE